MMISKLNWRKWGEKKNSHIQPYPVIDDESYQTSLISEDNFYQGTSKKLKRKNNLQVHSMIPTFPLF